MVSTTYTIQMASKLSGVGVHTIRAWEKRYKALEPSRDASGHRTYSKTDVEKLILLSELCLLGYTISKVANLSIPELKELLIDLGKTQESLEGQDFNLVGDNKANVDTSGSSAILAFAMKGQKLDIISLELSKLKNLLSPREFALTIIRPLYLELVSRLNSGESTPVQAEAVKSLLHFHSGHLLYHPHETKEKHSYHILIGGVPGEIHDIELSVMGLLCNHYNYRYTYLGSVISHEALIDIAHALEVHAVAFKSAGFQTQNYVEKLAHKLNPSIELLVVDNHDIETEKISSKRLQIFKTLDAFDDHLSKRIP